MEKEITSCAPVHVSRHKPLWTELRQQGEKATEKRLSKAKNFPRIGTTTERSKWWMQLKEGKKKDKLAMVIMASEYVRVLPQLSALQTTTNSQKEEIGSLKQKLSQQEEEIRNLKNNVACLAENSATLQGKINLLFSSLKKEKEVSKLREDELVLMSQCYEKEKRKVFHQEEEIRNLKDEVACLAEHDATLQEKINSLLLSLKKEKEVSKRRKDELDLMSQHCFEREDTLQQENTSLRQQLKEIKKHEQIPRLELIPSQESCQRSVVLSGSHSSPPLTVLDLLKDFPDLQRNHTNYEFWKKLRELAVMGLDPYFLFCLVKAKCPSKVWQAVTKEFKENSWLNVNHSNHGKIETMLEEFRRCVSKALGSVHYNLYFNRYQRPGESFEDYANEKFKLYCSYGDFKQEPDRNDELFLLTVIQTADEKYERMKLCSPSSYGAMIVSASTIDEKLKAERGSTCENCDRKGHSIAKCRRPGGGAEVENDECYTCGMSGHFARNCLYYWL